MGGHMGERMGERIAWRMTGSYAWLMSGKRGPSLSSFRPVRGFFPVRFTWSESSMRSPTP